MCKTSQIHSSVVVPDTSKLCTEIHREHCNFSFSRAVILEDFWGEKMMSWFSPLPAGPPLHICASATWWGRGNPGNAVLNKKARKIHGTGESAIKEAFDQPIRYSLSDKGSSLHLHAASWTSDSQRQLEGGAIESVIAVNTKHSWDDPYSWNCKPFTRPKLTANISNFSGGRS